MHEKLRRKACRGTQECRWYREHFIYKCDSIELMNEEMRKFKPERRSFRINERDKAIDKI